MRRKHLLRTVLLFLIFLVTLSQSGDAFFFPGGRGTAGPPEEFVGPFANWLCVRTLASGTCGPAAGGYGTATGNGSTDDTTAVQVSINALNDTHPILYFPPGTYKITAALTLTSGNFVSLIGADPTTTTISWGGGANSKVMLQVQGTHNSRVDRLTFNGNNNVGILIQQSQDNGTWFDTGNEYADDVFINAGGTYNGGTSVDFACGFTIGATALVSGNGCAETAMLRDQFTNGATGIMMGNCNAADMWVWSSTFTNKSGWGLFTVCGDYHVFSSNFFGNGLVSSGGDVYLVPNADQIFYGNYSSGSKRFMYCDGVQGAAAQVLENNTVINTALAQAVDCLDQGPTILLDNLFVSCTISDGCGSDNGSPVVRSNNFSNPTDMFSTGNSYTVGIANACSVTGDAMYSPSRCHAIGDNIVAHSHPAAPTLPGTPPQYCASGCPNRVTVYEETTSRTTSQIQADINSAAAIGGGATIHLQPGTYTLSATLSIPGNVFVQVIGDGYNTTVKAPGGGNPAIQCGTACKAWFRDFQIDGSSLSSPGIKIIGADQPGGRVFLEQPFLVQNLTGLLVNGLSSANVELHDAGLNANRAGTAGDAVNVIGAGTPSLSYTNIFATSGGCDNTNFVRTSGYANFTLRHLWHDVGCTTYANQTIAEVTGAGSFSMAAGRPYEPAGGVGNHTFNITDFSGTSAILGMFTVIGRTPEDVYISGAHAGSNLLIGYIGCNNAGPSFTDTASGDAYYKLDPQLSFNPTGCANQAAVTGQTSPDTETSQNVPALLAFLNTTLAPLRHALPTVPGAAGDPALAPGVTDTRIYRVLALACSAGVDVEP